MAINDVVCPKCKKGYDSTKLHNLRCPSCDVIVSTSDEANQRASAITRIANPPKSSNSTNSGLLRDIFDFNLKNFIYVEVSKSLYALIVFITLLSATVLEAFYLYELFNSGDLWYIALAYLVVVPIATFLVIVGTRMSIELGVAR